MTSTETLGAHLIIGLLSTFSPCLFPLLPMYLATQVKLKQSKLIAFLSSVFLILGILVVFLLIGIIIDEVGGFFLSNRLAFALGQAILLIFAGLLLIWKPRFLDKIRLPGKIEQYLFSKESQKNSLVFSFLLGLAYTIIAAPCAAGFFITVWGNVFVETLFLNKFLLILSFAIGAGLPFLFISLFIEEIRAETIGKIHSTSNKFSLIFGTIFIAVGIWLMADAFGWF